MSANLCSQILYPGHFPNNVDKPLPTNDITAASQEGLGCLDPASITCKLAFLTPVPLHNFSLIMWSVDLQVEVDWKRQSAGTFISSMDTMGADNALKILESKGSEFAKDVRQRTRELEAKAAVGISVEKAIKVAMKKNTTNEGRRT